MMQGTKNILCVLISIVLGILAYIGFLAVKWAYIFFAIGSFVIIMCTNYEEQKSEEDK